MASNVELLLMINTFWYGNIEYSERRLHIEMLKLVFSEMNESVNEVITGNLF
jgi:hypothetical protein